MQTWERGPPLALLELSVSFLNCLYLEIHLQPNMILEPQHMIEKSFVLVFPAEKNVSTISTINLFYMV